MLSKTLPRTRDAKYTRLYWGSARAKRAGLTYFVLAAYRAMMTDNYLQSWFRLGDIYI